eukprot:TRINITY_DN1293_c0_g2_i2.p2 TRINITY_DN1293_c0_g2~~TRINITY_DN1293_c0_g2_i2.p2  ORF type:complete len:358 (+),score=153.66 TRINITY_DN1293_c0_g2_i2:1349-2422(+)
MIMEEGTSLSSSMANGGKGGVTESKKEEENERKFFEECGKDIEFVQSSLIATQELTNKMSSILGSFENRLAQLRMQIIPIHSDTTRLKNTHSNIEKTIGNMNEIMEIFDTKSVVEQRIKEGFSVGSSTELDSYLSKMDRIRSSIDFLNSHKQFKSSEKTLIQLQGIKEIGIGYCEQAFVHLLIRDSINLEMNPFMEEGAMVPDQMELIKPEGIQEMMKLIKRFKESRTVEYLKEYKERRGKLLVSSLKKLTPEKTIKEDGLSKQGHPYFQFVRIAMTLFRSEQSLAIQLLGQEEYESHYFGLIFGGVELVIEIGDAIIKAKKNLEKGFGTFILIDLWANWKQIFSQNQKLLGVSLGV